MLKRLLSVLFLLVPVVVYGDVTISSAPSTLNFGIDFLSTGTASTSKVNLNPGSTNFYSPYFNPPPLASYLMSPGSYTWIGPNQQVSHDIHVGKLGGTTLNVSSGIFNTELNAYTLSFTTTVAVLKHPDKTKLLSFPDAQTLYMGYNSAIAPAGGAFNTCFGTLCMANISTGNFNTAMGNSVMTNGAVTGDLNNAIGYAALNGLTAGNYNVAMGGSSLLVLTGGSANTAIGTLSLASATGDNNTAIGYNASRQVTTGVGNVAVGYAAGLGTTTLTNANVRGNYNTHIGFQAGQSPSSSTVLSNTIAIGYNALVSTSNEAQIGGRPGSGTEVLVRTTSMTIEGTLLQVSGKDVCLEDGTNCVAGGGGGGTPIAFTTGTASTYSNPAISTPTSVGALLNTQFGITAAGTTAYINISPALLVVGASTAALQTQITATALSTQTLATAVGSSTSSLQTQITATALSTQTLATAVGSSTSSLQTQITATALSTQTLVGNYFPVKIGSSTIGPFDVSATSASATGASGLDVRYGLKAGTITTTSFNTTPTSVTVTGTAGLAVNGPGDGEIALTLYNSTFTVASSSWITVGSAVVYTSTWGTIGPGSGGSGTPGSPVNGVQFNSAGAFGASANFNWSGSSLSVLVPVRTSTTTILMEAASSGNTASGLNVYAGNTSVAGGYPLMSIGSIQQPDQVTLLDLQPLRAPTYGVRAGSINLGLAGALDTISSINGAGNMLNIWSSGHLILQTEDVGSGGMDIILRPREFEIVRISTVSGVNIKSSMTVTGPASIGTDVLVGGVSVCLEDGTNCPAAGAGGGDNLGSHTSTMTATLNYGVIASSVHANAFSASASSFTFLGPSYTVSPSTFAGGMAISSGIWTIPTPLIVGNTTLTSSMSLVLVSVPASGAITITLPPLAAYPGFNTTIYKVDSTTNAVNINAAGSDLILGTGTIKLNATGQSASLKNIVTVWGAWEGGIQTTPMFLGEYDGKDANHVITSSNIFICPFKTDIPVFITGWRYYRTVGGSNTSQIVLGIYDTAGKVVLSTGPVPDGAFGEITLSLATPFLLPPGQYYRALQASSLSSSYGSNSPNGANGALVCSFKAGGPAMGLTAGLGTSSPTRYFTEQILVVGGSPP